MEVRVFVVCQDCHRLRELVVEGPEVVVRLTHDCDGERGFADAEPEPARQLTMA